MIERTSVGAVRFEIISHDFVKQIALKDPDLFEVLQSLEKTKRLSTKDLAHNLYHIQCVDSQFLYGPWVDPNASLLHCTARGRAGPKETDGLYPGVSVCTQLITCPCFLTTL